MISDKYLVAMRLPTRSKDMISLIPKKKMHNRILADTAANHKGSNVKFSL